MYTRAIPDMLAVQNGKILLVGIVYQKLAHQNRPKEEPMNNLYSWHDERMVALEMDSFRREIESIRLLRDAGLSNPGWLERVFIAIGNTLVKTGQQLRENYTTPRQAYQITSGKFAA
jgi:hypothetical protein